ncbi:MAG: tRNA (N6-threonylcarbamoyladenosine(37)-N6)-methyltransferase TrmO [Dehalococcoidia bacterium]
MGLRRLFGRGADPEIFPGLPAIPVEPIGWVRNGIANLDRHDWSGVRSRISLRPELAAALAGIEGFSHIIVVCWLDRVAAAERTLTAVHPAGDRRLPARGVLALRTHHRPNPIAVSVVSLERVDGATLHVTGLDAADRTPVLDVKPYLPFYDSVPPATLPDWAEG